MTIKFLLYYNISFFSTLLHYATKSGNIDLVKYIISFDEIYIGSKTISSNFIMFSFKIFYRI